MFIRYRGIERSRTVVHCSFTTNEGARTESSHAQPALLRQHPSIPTSRQKRARYGAPSLVVGGHPRSVRLEASLLRLLVGVFGIDNTLLENLADPLAQGAISLKYEVANRLLRAPAKGGHVEIFVVFKRLS